jgi:ubiquinol-cytochrome c reductase cytochrome c1 subunit
MKTILCYLLLLPTLVFAGTHTPSTLPAHVNLHDKASLQRGAKWYMNYCFGCHALSYQRYKRTAEDIGVAHYTGEADQNLMQANLIFTGAKIGDRMINALSNVDAKTMFGVAPPDLTLETRVRGADWVYTYLLSFYTDETTTWGVNNLLFPGVAMPNVLANLQGQQIPIYREEEKVINGKTKTFNIIDHLQPLHTGHMDPIEFEQVVHDIVNFLSYVGKPNQLKREFIGIFVLLFLVIMVLLTYALKQDFWREVKKTGKK